MFLVVILLVYVWFVDKGDFAVAETKKRENQMLDLCRIEEGHDDVLLKPAQEVTFPLNDEVKDFIADFIYTYDNLENCAGLAAPQVGKAYRIFIADIDEEVRQYRDDLDELLPFTVFINPSYEGIGDEKRADWEGCFSVRDTVGQVYRYTRINFRYYNEEGQLIEREYTGFLARLFQHETDHLYGTLCSSKYAPDKPKGTFEEIRALRQKEIEARQEKLKAEGS